ncbi:MAG: NAD(P)H-hydrate dehydratase [Geminicoccales bacterium]
MNSSWKGDAGLYTIAQMREADAKAIEGGIAGIELMEKAGTAVAEVILRNISPVDTVVLCGPGNNGGDGFVAAQRLLKAGWSVRVALIGDSSRLQGDALIAKDRWTGKTSPAEPAVFAGAGLVVDALFGAGLARPINGQIGDLINGLNECDIPVVAVDIPSGIDGDTGDCRGAAIKASMTVTFHRSKPGHYLLPGRAYTGRLIVADISIPKVIDRTLGIDVFANLPALWRQGVPRRDVTSHKYRHGHALVLGGGISSSGAARLAARAALRIGAGLVTVLCPASALPVYAIALEAVMVDPFKDEVGFTKSLSDPRRNAILLGPGAGVGERLRAQVGASLSSNKKCVLDADALTSFADAPDRLFEMIKDNGTCLLTPHEGEFSRLFDIVGDKLTRARAAARMSGAVILLKGPDTVVACPDGRCSILTEAPATLATAGSGDVLAGIVLGLMAQSMPIFEAASAAAWLHAEAAKNFGSGLIAEDLPDLIPGVLTSLEA